MPGIKPWLLGIQSAACSLYLLGYRDSSHVMTELLHPEYVLFTRMEQMINGSKIIVGKLERKNSRKKYKIKE